MEKISIDIDKMKKNIYELWIDTENGYPIFVKKNNYFRKIKMGKKLDFYIKSFFGLVDKLIKNSLNVDECKSKIISLAKTWFIEGYPDKIDDTIHLEEFINDMCKVTEDFIRKAKEFCKEVDNKEIFQALRNVWAMVTYQYAILGEIKLTKSIFAYSMLYPCTDNYIDDRNVTYKQKELFNSSILKILMGFKVDCENYKIKRVARLIGMIELEYPRAEYQHIYDAMVFMQKAQQLSLNQQKTENTLNEKELLKISIEKGGLSVLMHGYLVSGNVDNAGAEFLFGFGVLLQICDDIQDIKEDLKSGHYTLATKVGEQWNLDAFTNNLFAFCRCVFKNLNRVQNANNSWIYSIMELKIYNLIVYAVYSSRYMYSKGYTRSIVKSFPYTMFYLKTFNLKWNFKMRKLKKNIGNKNVCELFL